MKKNGLLFLVAASMGALTLGIVLEGCSPTGKVSFNRKPPPTKTSPATTLSLVAFSDLHGALGAKVDQTKAGSTVTSGGAALLSAYVQRIKEKTDGPTIILDGGDMFQGTLISNTVEGAPVIQFYNYLGLHGAAVGNHEFDFGPVGPDSTVKRAGQDPRGAIKKREVESQFPFLAANVRNKEGKVPSWIKPSVLLTVQGVKVGIVGGATKSTPNTTVGKNLVGLTFAPIAPDAIREAKKLRAQGAQFVFLTLHAGSGCSNNKFDAIEDLSSCKDHEELFQVVKALPKGLVNAVVGGHTHQGVFKNVNGTMVVQSYARSSSFSWIEFSLEDQKPKKLHGLVSVCGEVVPVENGTSCLSGAVRASERKVEPAFFLGKKITPDSKVDDLLEKDFARVKKIKDAPLGVMALSAFKRNYSKESAMGNFVADMMLKWAGTRADVGLTNNGGIRENFRIGPLTYGDVFAVLPFDNKPAIIETSGKLLKRMIELGAGRARRGQSWAGITFKSENCKMVSAEIQGQPFDINKVYRVVTNDYLAGGGSGFGSLNIDPTKIKTLDEEAPLRDLVVKVLKKEGRDIVASNHYNSSARRQNVVIPCGGGSGASSHAEAGHMH